MDKQRADRFIWRDGDTVESKPTVKLIGGDGNAFAILGACQCAAKKAGWSQARWNEVRNEMMASDYNHLLATAMEHFTVQ